MTDLLGSKNADMKANAGSTLETEHATVNYDGSTAAGASASERGADLGGLTQHTVGVDSEHVSGSASAGGALDGALDAPGLPDVDLPVDAPELPDVPEAPAVDAGATGAFDAMLDAMDDLWAQVSGSISAMLGL